MSPENQTMCVNLVLAQEHKSAAAIAEMASTSKIPEVHRAIRVYLADRKFAEGYSDSADRGMAMHEAREKFIASLDELKEEA